MNARSLRFRLIAWYAGWLTLVFAGFGLFVYFGLRQYLETNLRDSLTRRARQVGEMIQRSQRPWTDLGMDVHEIFTPEINSRFIRLTSQGVTVYISGPPADGSFDPASVPAPAPGERKRMSRRIPVNDTSVFVEALPVTVKGKPFLVEVGGSNDPIEATLHEWLVVLGLGLIPLVLVAMSGGYVLVQRALQPVTQMVRTAEQISSQNLGERLPVPGTGDELDQLSLSLNNMIRRLDEAFQHTQRFLADASHELRTPLTIVQGELEQIAENTRGQPGVREVAHSALEEVERLRKIVEGLFALSRLDAGEAQQQSVFFDLGELAASTAEQMCLLAHDKGISIQCRAAGKVPVQGDPARLKQVVVNLIHNAIQYTPAQGRIDVVAEARDGRAVLHVTDNGIGIPGIALPLIFERFFRVDKARSRAMGGAGLGLPIVKAICAAHGGTVEVQSTEGQGSRFTVKLPLADSLTR